MVIEPKQKAEYEALSTSAALERQGGLDERTKSLSSSVSSPLPVRSRPRWPSHLSETRVRRGDDSGLHIYLFIYIHHICTYIYDILLLLLLLILYITDIIILKHIITYNSEHPQFLPVEGLLCALPMQRNCTELTERLLKSLDKEYNVSNARVFKPPIDKLLTVALF